MSLPSLTDCQPVPVSDHDTTFQLWLYGQKVDIQMIIQSGAHMRQTEALVREM